MNLKQAETQLTFLASVGLYQGPLDQGWNNEAQSAMTGWAYKHHSGNLDGSPFTDASRVPDGYSLVHGFLLPIGSDTQPSEEAAAAPVDSTSSEEPVNEILSEEPTSEETPKEHALSEPDNFVVTGEEEPSEVKGE